MLQKVRSTVALLALSAVCSCAGGRVVRLETEVDQLRARLEQEERARAELQKELEALRREGAALRDELARAGSPESGVGGAGGGASELSGPAEAGPELSRQGLTPPPEGPAVGLEEVDLELPAETGSPVAVAPRSEPEAPLPRPAPVASVPSGVAEAPSSLDVVGGEAVLSSADDLYAEAFANFQKSSYHKAILQFNVFVERYPQHDLTDNAFYWMGECWYGLRNYPRAIAAFETVLERFPKGNKAPDSLLKKAYSLQRAGKSKEALAALQELIERFPQSSSAGKAQLKVKELQETQS